MRVKSNLGADEYDVVAQFTPRHTKVDMSLPLDIEVVVYKTMPLSEIQNNSPINLEKIKQ